MESRTVHVRDADLHVGVTGRGPDVVVLTGGPGCVQYLEHDALAPRGHRAWFPEPRGVGRSGGGPHTMEDAVADLEAIRESAGVATWTVLGHSWGCDLGVRYAVEHPEVVAAVVGIAGRGPQRDRTWSELAALVPRGRFSTVPGVPHDFWSTHPDVWTDCVTDACTAA